MKKVKKEERTANTLQLNKKKKGPKQNTNEYITWSVEYLHYSSQFGINGYREESCHFH